MHLCVCLCVYIFLFTYFRYSLIPKQAFMQEDLCFGSKWILVLILNQMKRVKSTLPNWGHTPPHIARQHSVCDLRAVLGRWDQ